MRVADGYREDVEPSVLSFASPPRSASACDEPCNETLVCLEGEHDAFTAPGLCESLERAIASGGADLVVDLSRVEFMSAATVGVLVQARGELRRRSRSLVVRSPSPIACRVLDICGLSELVTR
jgi:anti-anti-sigma factor